MKRIKIFKAYFILWLFVYFIAVANWETFTTYFLSTLTFNIAIVSLLGIGTFMMLKGSKDLVMMAGTFGVLMYKKGDISFYLKGIEKVLPTTFANKILSRVKSGELMFTQQEKEDLLAWISETFANQNKYNNFFIGTVLMIGLLGTFAGLLGAIGSMGDIVKSLAGSNVDIGKIMAGFAGPLGSMAVGFGSSLFGVISAILMSVKGYLLNKAQASLLEGVENWLNSKTLEVAPDEAGGVAVSPTNKLESHDKSFVDIFLERISLLTNEIQNLSTSNHEEKQRVAFMMEQLSTKLESGFENIDATNKKLLEIQQREAKISEAGIILQKDTHKELQNLKELYKKGIQRDKELINELKEIQENQKIETLQLIEKLYSFDNEHKKLKAIIESENSVERESDFFTRHLNKELIKEIDG